MNFYKKKRILLLFTIIFVILINIVYSDSDDPSRIEVWCEYSDGTDACRDARNWQESTTCTASVANGQCAVEGNVECYSQSDCEVGISNDGPDYGYNVNWDARQADCECIGGYWTNNFEAGLSPNCCEDPGDANENYITNPLLGSEACCDILENPAGECVDENNECQENRPEEGPLRCLDFVDNDCDGFVDMGERYCMTNITGTVYDDEGNPIPNAKVQVFNGSIELRSTFTDINGNYLIYAPNGTHNMVASKEEFISETKVNVFIPIVQTIPDIDFYLTTGKVCEPDCTYLLDDTCHSSCDGVNGCSFFDFQTAQLCDNAKEGWEVPFNDQIVLCCSGGPEDKTLVKAKPTCTYGNVIKYYRILYYRGQAIRMVTVICGD